jgi:hypothetical protein
MHDLLFRKVTLFALAMGAAACGSVPAEGPGEELVATSEAAINESTCTTTAADITVTEPPSPRLLAPIVTPTRYDHSDCRQAYVIDGAWTSTSASLWVIEWADPWDRTEAQCNGTRLSVELMSTAGSPAFVRYGYVTMTSTWNTLTRRCVFPIVNINDTSMSIQSLAKFETVTYPSIRTRFLRIAVRALTNLNNTQPVLVRQLVR